ncbi:hypothetical protein BC834DRAFT_251660 [Gloeopeniophorella convolvens]|nr:hypothetical protein BC834DRAFT_251660 [Gloeopeniophorella convolvens]
MDVVGRFKFGCGGLTGDVQMASDSSMIPPEDKFDIPTMDDAAAFDQFSFLLNDPAPTHDSSSADSSSSNADSPPDWSQFSNSWHTDDSPLNPGNVKFDPTSLGFDLTLPLDMDIDFNPTLAVDPSALHFDPKMFAPADPSPFQPQQQSMFTQNLAPRRMSITSSSSSSGASLSPVLGPASASSSVASVPSTATTSPHLTSNPAISLQPAGNDPVDELAHSVRQTAGVTLAVPVQGQAEQFSFTNPQKLPIPRLPRPSPPAAGTSAKRKSPSVESTPSPDPALGGTIATIGRPKTSHTTIERRYRTNLNARIQSLKDAVPALRVLESKDRAKKGEEGAEAAFEDGKSDRPVWNDVVDERGFVDGVKVARKISKANVLGKAAEYIHVLKRRETRLKREQVGLRSLISGLVGGPALLREWEREWVSRFGGPERDEGTSDMSDDDGADEGESDDDEDGLRPKKRAKGAPKKVVKEPKAKKEDTPPGVVPEKRKRGRPRKVQPVPEVPALQLQQQQQPQETVAPPAQQQPAQYLLAAFAFFSFFNSPLTSSYSRPPPAHSGVVLADSGPVVAPTSSYEFGWQEALQIFHLVASGLICLTILSPFLPKSVPSLRKLLPSANFPRTDAARRLALIDALDASHRGIPDEAALLRTALGVYPGASGLLLSFASPKRGGKAKTLEHMQLEQRAWVRLAELAVFDLNSGSTSFGLRAQAYWGMVSRTSTFAPSPGDLATLALLVFPVWRSRAAALWARANRARVVRPFERAVIGAMTVEEACKSLAKTHNARLSPLGSLAVRNVRKAVAHVAGRTFVRAVLGADVRAGESEVYDAEKDAREEEERRAVVDAGRSMGGRSAELVGLLERICTGAFVRAEETALLDDAECDAEERGVRTLLGALVLHRALFPSGLQGGAGVSIMLSPPPSPSRRNAGLRAALRVALDGEVFYGGDGDLEEARDRVVDMLVEVDRASRRRV